MDSCSLKIQEMKKTVISDEISDLENMNFRFISSPMKNDELSPHAITSRAVSTTPVSVQKGPRMERSTELGRRPKGRVRSDD